MLIDGVSIQNYRSFGEAGVKIPGCQKINILIGQNNSGKSNILHFIAKAIKSSKSSGRSRSKDPVDIPYGAVSLRPIVGFALRRDGCLCNAIFNKIAKQNEINTVGLKEVKDIIFQNRAEIWLYYEINDNGVRVGSPASILRTAEELSLPDRDWQRMQGPLARVGGGSLDSWRRVCIDAQGQIRWMALGLTNPGNSVTPHSRTSGRGFCEEGSVPRGDVDHSGAGLIDELFQQKTPPWKGSGSGPV